MPFGDWSNIYGGSQTNRNPPALTWDNPEAYYRSQQMPTEYSRLYEEFLRQQSQLGNRGLDIKQGLLESLAPAIMKMLGGSFAGGGGGYKTDYGAGIYSPMQMTGGAVSAQMPQAGAHPGNFRRFGPANYITDYLGR